MLWYSLLEIILGVGVKLIRVEVVVVFLFDDILRVVFLIILFLDFVGIRCCCCWLLLFGYCFFRVVNVFIMLWKLFEILLSWVKRLFFSILGFVMLVILIFVIIFLFLGGWMVFGWVFVFCFVGMVVFCLSKMFLYLLRWSFWLVVSLI